MSQPEVEFVDSLPVKGGGTNWANRLLPLLEHPNRWALVWTSENPGQASGIQSNLHGRKLLIPEPEHFWEFAARGCEVYAVYRGRAMTKRGQRASLRRVDRKR